MSRLNILVRAVASATLAVWAPCIAQSQCSDRSAYPVIVYSAAARTASLQMARNGSLIVPSVPATFLCDGKPVEIFVVDRKLLSTYSAPLTTPFTLPAKPVDPRGATPPPTQPPPSGNTPPPAAKGIILPAPNINLLTTDQAVSLLLDNETFD